MLPTPISFTICCVAVLAIVAAVAVYDSNEVSDWSSAVEIGVQPKNGNHSLIIQFFSDLTLRFRQRLNPLKVSLENLSNRVDIICIFSATLVVVCTIGWKLLSSTKTNNDTSVDYSHQVWCTALRRAHKDPAYARMIRYWDQDKAKAAPNESTPENEANAQKMMNQKRKILESLERNDVSAKSGARSFAQLLVSPGNRRMLRKSRD